MRTLYGMIGYSGYIGWQTHDTSEEVGEELTVSFPFHRQVRPHDARRFVADALRDSDVGWLQRRGDRWTIDLDELRAEVPEVLKGLDWATGRHTVSVEVFDETPFLGKGLATRVQFVVTKELVMSSYDRIFLSHKGVDKPLVRAFKTTLEAIGLKPWLDEDAMPAGSSLERGILKGFKDSCAAVFFVTEAFADEGFLGSEVEYAVGEKRAKGDRFAIITLVFAKNDGTFPDVPDLLRRYVWKQPADNLEALREIVWALPVELRSDWKASP